MLWLFPKSSLLFPTPAAWITFNCSLAVQLFSFLVGGSARLVSPHCYFLFWEYGQCACGQCDILYKWEYIIEQMLMPKLFLDWEKRQWISSVSARWAGTVRLFLLHLWDFKSFSGLLMINSPRGQGEGGSQGSVVCGSEVLPWDSSLRLSRLYFINWLYLQVICLFCFLPPAYIANYSLVCFNGSWFASLSPRWIKELASYLIKEDRGAQDVPRSCCLGVAWNVFHP